METGYAQAMLRTAGPRRRRHLEQIIANESHMRRIAQEAKAKRDAVPA